jgi:hypothetical protein
MHKVLRPAGVLKRFGFAVRAGIGRRDGLSGRRPGHCFGLMAFGILTAHCMAAAGGNLIGWVVDGSNDPVAGARILISHAASGKYLLPGPPVASGALAVTVMGDAAGLFHAEGLAPGQYLACAETVAPGYLDPCHWSAVAPSFVVNSGKTTSGIKVVMQKGQVLSVQVKDPQKLLNPVSGPVDMDLEIHVVTSKGVHYSMPIQSSNATGRNHAITVPFNTPVTLRVLAAHLVVNDESGKAFAAAGVAASAPVGSPTNTVVLTVAGRK